MSEIDLQIITNFYYTPYNFKGKKRTDGNIVTYEWTEQREPMEAPSSYKLTLITSEGTATLQRNGHIKSMLNIAAGQRTKGVVETGYGQMDLNIETLYINTPNMFSRSLEIAYKLDENTDLNTNTFIIKEI